MRVDIKEPLPNQDGKEALLTRDGLVVVVRDVITKYTKFVLARESKRSKSRLLSQLKEVPGILDILNNGKIQNEMIEVYKRWKAERPKTNSSKKSSLNTRQTTWTL